MVPLSPLHHRQPSVTESVALPPDPRRNAMADSKYAAAISLIAVESDPCPKCQGPMILARIMPGRLNFDLRAFECVRCNHIEKALVAIDRAARLAAIPAGESPAN